MPAWLSAAIVEEPVASSEPLDDGLPRGAAEARPQRTAEVKAVLVYILMESVEMGWLERETGLQQDG